MEADNSLENQVKTLQKQFGGMAKLVKAFKSTVESLEQKVSQKENHEIQEILMLKNEVSMGIIEKDEDENHEVKIRKRCRYFNRGYCKHTIRCRYLHADKICQNISRNTNMQYKYKCASFKYTWESEGCVVKHVKYTSA